MPTRTRLTTPPHQRPDADDRAADRGEAYVPGPALPREPRVPGPRLGLRVAIGVAAAVIAVTATVIAVGERAFEVDPSLPVPGEPGGDQQDPAPEDEPGGQLPQA